MLCDECGEREATIHEVIIRNGQRSEKHMCERCAQSSGLGPKSPVGGIVQGLVASTPSAPAKPKQPTCDVCGLTYSAFRDSELLGCPSCYTSFESQLTPLLGRTHEGGTHHVGKTPKRALEVSRSRSGAEAEQVLGDAETRAARVAHLRRQLDQALKGEHYEQAARLRDEIHSIETGRQVRRDEGPES